jgi:hypothetical protein
MQRTQYELPLGWQHIGDGDGVVGAHDGVDGEYVVRRVDAEMRTVDPAPEGWWYWCAGHSSELDDNVCGFVATKQEAIRCCERVARWRMAKAAA